MSGVQVMNENYFDPDYYQSFSYSSQKVTSPASNVLNFVRRSKAWRSDGYWEITSANKGIVLQEVDTVNQTLNIAEGVYTTDAAFLTAVKAALDAAAGTAVYTVTRDTTTKKIKITSDGAGSAILKLICTNASFTAASVLGFSTSSDLTGSLTYTADALKIHTSEWLKLDAGTSVNPKAFCLIGKRNYALGISATAVVKLQGNSVDTWTSPAFEATLTHTEHGFVLVDPEGLHTVALRYWRLYIEDKSNPLGYIEISNIYLGEVIATTRGAVRFPLEETEVDPSNVEYSLNQNAFSNDLEKYSEINLQWNHLTVSEAEAMKTFRREVGSTKPFFVCLDPDEVFTSDAMIRTLFVRFRNDMDMKYVNLQNFESSWNLREEV